MGQSTNDATKAWTPIITTISKPTTIFSKWNVHKNSQRSHINYSYYLWSLCFFRDNSESLFMCKYDAFRVYCDAVFCDADVVFTEGVCLIFKTVIKKDTVSTMMSYAKAVDWNFWIFSIMWESCFVERLICSQVFYSLFLSHVNLFTWKKKRTISLGLDLGLVMKVKVR